MCRCQSQPLSTVGSDRTASGPWSRSDSSSPASALSRSDSQKEMDRGIPHALPVKNYPICCIFLLSANIQSRGKLFIGVFYLEPSHFNVLSGEFTLQSGGKFFLYTDISQCSQDSNWCLCQFIQSNQSVTHQSKNIINQLYG